MLCCCASERGRGRDSAAWFVQGKTTLCQCLLSVPGSDLKLHDGTATSHQQFLEDPESLCSTVSWDDTADKVKWIYKVQDTPGTPHAVQQFCLKFCAEADHTCVGAMVTCMSHLAITFWSQLRMSFAALY